MELIGKIESLASEHQARGLRRQVWVKNRIKSMNESIYYLVDDLHAAIDGDRRIRFHYFQYDPRGKKQLRRGGFPAVLLFFLELRKPFRTNGCRCVIFL